MEIVAGVAGQAISNIFDRVIELMTDVIEKEENCQILHTDLERMENLLLDITTLFKDQQKEAPETLKNWLQRLENSLTEAKSLLDRSSQPVRCLDCLICNPVRLSKEIKAWKVAFDNLFQGLQNDLSTFDSAQQIAKSAPRKALLQDVPPSGFVGSGIDSAKEKVEMWLTETDNVHIIGVWGMGGVGKTSFLKVVYNHYIEVSNVFQHVIWVTVSADYKVLDLQARIAKAINLVLPSNSDIDTQKMLLSANLKEKRFLLVLDDLWHPLNLQELGVAFGEDKQSKVLLSTRNRDLIPAMRAEKSIPIQPLSKEEAWMLFRTIAFNGDTVSVSMDIMECARKIAEECKGLPLAITVIAAAMIGKTSVDQWEVSLDLMKTADPSFPDTHPRVDPELYQRLRWSYDALPNSNVKNCFLYCAMFPEDYEIPVRNLLQIWIAEGLVRSKQGSHFMDMAIGRSYVNLLVDRCLFQNVSRDENIYDGWEVLDGQTIRVHDCLRDMAIYIGEKDENCVFKAGQQLQNFPEIQNEDCKRISVSYTEIQNLPTLFTRPKLVSLFLNSIPIEEIASGFLVSLTSLKVLDLSYSRISSIPSSVGELKQLEFLNLSRLEGIRDLPAEICHLSSLQFLDLSSCIRLLSLPSEIGELKTLKYLNLEYCWSLRVIPHEISQLTSLSILDAKEAELSVEAAELEASIWSLKSLRNLTMLRTRVKVDVQWRRMSSGMKVGIMGNWLEMRHLCLYFTNGDYVMEDLPRDMHNMNKLQSFTMRFYNGLSLPDYIGKFQHLEYLELNSCPHLSQLYPLEHLPNLKYLELHTWPHLKDLGIGNSGNARGFLMLEILVLNNLERLESIAEPSNNGVWNESVLPKLHTLGILGCGSLKRLPRGMEKLTSLNTIIGEEDWWQSIEDDNMKRHLQNLFHSI